MSTFTATVPAITAIPAKPAKAMPPTRKRREFVTGLTLGGQIGGSMTTLSQARKPPSIAALRRACGVAPFLIRSF